MSLNPQLKADLQAELNDALVAVRRTVVRRVIAALADGSAERLALAAALEDAPELAGVTGLHVMLPRRMLEDLIGA